jgi:hypothetical protein
MGGIMGNFKKTVIGSIVGVTAIYLVSQVDEWLTQPTEKDLSEPWTMSNRAKAWCLRHPEKVGQGVTQFLSEAYAKASPHDQAVMQFRYAFAYNSGRQDFASAEAAVRNRRERLGLGRGSTSPELT